MIDLIKEIWQTMCTNKLRTLLTGLSVAWGIFMLILLVAMSQGVINSFDEQMSRSDHNVITVWPGRTSKAWQGLKEGRLVQLKDRNRADIAAGSPATVTAVDGTITFSGRVSTSRDYLSGGSVTGAFPGQFDGRFTLVDGRFINQADINESRKVMVLKDEDAVTLFGSADGAVGKVATCGNVAFTVVGIYHHDWERNTYIPYSTARAMNGYTDNIGSIDVHFQGIDNREDARALNAEVQRSLAESNHFDPADDSAVHMWNELIGMLEAKQAQSILNIAMWVIGLLTLVTGIVGVSNIMFVSVKERTHEIGIRRAIGAKPRNILTQIVVEAVAMTTVFGYIGIVMGTLACELIKKLFEGQTFILNPTVDLGIAVQVTVALIVAGALAGIFPALRALKIKPVEALRDE